MIKNDEAGWRVKGRNLREWVLVSQAGIYHQTRPSRGQDVIDDVMGVQRAEVWLGDCRKPQLNAPPWRPQLCLPHQL